ncbi:uncharacterized protein LOC144323485 [Canis aureus]
MARPRPWPALPGHPGPAPPRRPELPPPSSQPAGPPGCAVRLRGLSPPPPWAGPAATRSHWSARRGLGARGRGYARPRPPGADSDGGSRGSSAGVARSWPAASVLSAVSGGVCDAPTVSRSALSSPRPTRLQGSLIPLPGRPQAPKPTLARGSRIGHQES